MGWEQRGSGQYYYRKRREGGRVVSEYIGRGPEAEVIAKIDALDRAKRENERELAKAERDYVEELEPDLKELRSIIETLVDAHLLAEGYHTHKGEWRRKRGEIKRR